MYVSPPCCAFYVVAIILVPHPFHSDKPSFSFNSDVQSGSLRIQMRKWLLFYPGNHDYLLKIMSNVFVNFFVALVVCVSVPICSLRCSSVQELSPLASSNAPHSKAKLTLVSHRRYFLSRFILVTTKVTNLMMKSLCRKHTHTYRHTSRHSYEYIDEYIRINGFALYLFMHSLWLFSFVKKSFSQFFRFFPFVLFCTIFSLVNVYVA